jgi:NAD(P)-dependent dehydrogenase (short-subunit alcohol dehydrogenase family)
VIGDLNADAGHQLVADVGQPDRLTFIRTDISEEHDVHALIGAATERYGRLDVVFNNAGSGGAFGPITEIDVDHWDRTFAVLVRSVFLGVKHAARVMIAQGDGGSIINTASIAGQVGGSGPQAYSAAKAAVINLTLNAAAELAPHRIRVNAICPGPVRTQMSDTKATPQSTSRHSAAAPNQRRSPQPSPSSPPTTPPTSPARNSPSTAATSPADRARFCLETATPCSGDRAPPRSDAEPTLFATTRPDLCRSPPPAANELASWLRWPRGWPRVQRTAAGAGTAAASSRCARGLGLQFQSGAESHNTYRHNVPQQNEKTEAEAKKSKPNLGATACAGPGATV